MKRFPVILTVLMLAACGGTDISGNENENNTNANDNVNENVNDNTNNTAECGNGEVEEGESCDGTDLRGETCISLGHPSGPLACSLTCSWDTSGCTGVPPICGNSTIEATELCDDGNLTACDGCSPTCLIEACGNGVVECGEQCDDNNTSAGDGCSPTCILEGPSVCGNGFVQAGEQCDDGNLAACDGCSPTCLIEVCGNGVQDCGETCDDGNTSPGDGCGPTCLIEMCGNDYLDPGENCEPALDPYCHGDCVSFCGDGVEQGNYNEYCDDGNNVDGDNCYSDCTGNCGDGLVHDGVTYNAAYGGVPPDHGEECEPQGVYFDEDATCDSDCTFVVCGDGHCNSWVEDVNNCPQDCVPATCGNGVCDYVENMTNCTQDCPCGNGICEPGWGDDNSNCPSDCLPTCGNGVCDDGEWGVTYCFVDCYVPCGDGICDSNENHGLCPQDCP